MSFYDSHTASGSTTLDFINADAAYSSSNGLGGLGAGGAYGGPGASDFGGGMMSTSSGIISGSGATMMMPSQQGHYHPFGAGGAAGSVGGGGVGGSMGGSGGQTGFEDEPPLLEELGINFDQILAKTKQVLHPLRTADQHIMDDTDLAGPLIFVVLFGCFLLMSGKIHFGSIYGVGVLGSLAVYAILNLMSENGVSLSCIISVLGYCLLPMVMLSSLSILFSLQGLVGLLLTILTVAWCSYSASSIFVAVLTLREQLLLVIYPCFLLYGLFALMTVF